MTRRRHLMALWSLAPMALGGLVGSATVPAALGATASAVVLVAAAGSPAHAAKSSAADRRKAKRFYAEGKEHMKAGRFGLASVAFENAFQLDPNPVLMWNVARAYEEDGKLARAKQRFQTLIGMKGAPQALVDRAKERISDIDARAAKAADAERLERERAEKERLRLELERKEAARKAEEEEAKRKAQEAALKASQQEFEDRSQLLSISGWTAVGLGVVLAGAGVALHFVAESDRDNVRIPSETVPEIGAITSVTQVEAKSIEQRADSMDTLGAVGTAVGGAVLATGVTLLVIDALAAPPVMGSVEVEDAGLSTTPKARWRVGGAPLPGGGLAVTATGRF